MKAMSAVLALLLVPIFGPDYEKMLSESKITLTEAIDRAVAETKSGTPFNAALETEKGRTVFCVEIAREAKTLELHLAVEDGRVLGAETENEDRTAVANAAGIGLKGAIEAALKTAKAKAVAACLRQVPPAEGGKTQALKIEAVVRTWGEGKLRRWKVDVQSGAVSELKWPGLLGVKASAVEGGLKISELVKDAPAASAGLQKDDLLVSINGQAIKTSKDLHKLIRDLGEGAKVKVGWQRAGKASETEITLAALQDEDDDDDEDDEDDDDDDDMDDDD